MRQVKNDIECKHLVNHTIHKFHVDWVHPFWGTDKEAFEMAKLDKNQYLILSINYFKGNPFLRTGMTFNVTFEDGSIDLGFNADLYDSQQMEQFIYSTPSLFPLRFTAKQAKIEVAKLKKLSITQVREGDTVYLNLRFFNFLGYTWYDEVGFDDPNTTYFVPIKIGMFVSNKKLKVNATVITHGNKRLILDNYDLVAYVSLQVPNGKNDRVLTLEDKARFPNAWRNLIPK